ncbi:MAG: ketose-bisphosphate aldolase [Spirosomataceae bacterium]
MFQLGYGRYAIAAINVFTMEQILGVFEAAHLASSPVILQTTPVARQYATPTLLLSMIEAASQLFPEVVYGIHLDHGIESHIDSALERGGYTSVMIDASHDDLETNISRTRSIVQKAHALGIAVEAELGILSGVEDDISIEASQARYTQPKEVAYFVQQTGCDSLAIAIGTSHGAYKFKGDQGIQLEILREIQATMPGYPLVLHGGSAVNPLEIERINASGGNMQVGSRGVDDSEIQAAIPLGICKINIATDLRVLWARTHREFFKQQPEAFDPIIPGKKYREELVEFCIQKFELFHSAGKSTEYSSII